MIYFKTIYAVTFLKLLGWGGEGRATHAVCPLGKGLGGGSDVAIMEDYLSPASQPFTDHISKGWFGRWAGKMLIQPGLCGCTERISESTHP